MLGNNNHRLGRGLELYEAMFGDLLRPSLMLLVARGSSEDGVGEPLLRCFFNAYWRCPSNQRAWPPRSTSTNRDGQL